jgi:superfamily II DNA/RNA helicase
MSSLAPNQTMADSVGDHHLEHRRIEANSKTDASRKRKKKSPIRPREYETGDSAVNSITVTASWEDLIQSELLRKRLQQQGYNRPTLIQVGAYPLLRNHARYSSTEIENTRQDMKSWLPSKSVILGSQSATGKTLAYLLPLLDEILTQKQEQTTSFSLWSHLTSLTGIAQSGSSSPYRYCRAIVLLPNIELAHQVMDMALPLARGVDALQSKDPRETVHMTLIPSSFQQPHEFAEFRSRIAELSSGTSEDTAPFTDILVATPLTLGPLGARSTDYFWQLFADCATLVVDQADMFINGQYRDLEKILPLFRRGDKHKVREEVYTAGDSSSVRRATKASALASNHPTQYVFVASTLSTVDGLGKSVNDYLTPKYPLARRVVLPSGGPRFLQHCEYVKIRTMPDRMKDLLKRLLPVASGHSATSTSSVPPKLFAELLEKEEGKHDAETSLVEERLGIENDLADLQRPIRIHALSSRGSLAGKKVLVFANTLNDVETFHRALTKLGIPGALYHAKLPLEERQSSLKRFRQAPGTAPVEEPAVQVLVCTDLASRALDISGVEVVVHLACSLCPETTVHRMDRSITGGRAIVYYHGKVEALIAERIRSAFSPGDDAL